MRKASKRFFFGSGILFGLILLLFLVTIFYLQTDHARLLIQEKVNGLIPGSISCKKLRLSMLTGELELMHVLLKDPDGKSLAGFDRLFVDLSLITLLKGNLTVAMLVLEKPWATLKVDKEGEINLVDIFFSPDSIEEKPVEKEGGGIPINIVLKSLKLLHGSVRFEIAAEDIMAEAQDVELAVSGNLLKRSGNISFKIGKGYLESPEIQTGLDYLKMEATFGDGRIDPLFFQANTHYSELTLFGNIDGFLADPSLNLDLRLTLFLPEIRKALSPEPILTGRITARMTVQGKPDNPQATCLAVYDGGMLSGERIDRIKLDCLLKDRLMTINGLKVDAAYGHFNLKGEVDLKEAFVKGFFASQRDLEAISYRVSLEQSGTKLENLQTGSKNLKGVVSSNIFVHGKGISLQTLSAKAEIKAFAKDFMAGPSESPIDIHVKNLLCMNKGIVNLKQLEAETGDLRIRTKGCLDLSSKKVRAALTLEDPSITDTLSAFGLRNISGMFGLKADISGSIKKPVFDFTMEGKHLSFQDITMGNIRLNAGLDRSGTLRVSQFVLENQDSAIQGDGWIRLFKDYFEIDKENSLNISFILSRIELQDFFNKESVKGTINGRLNLGGSLKEPEVSLSLQGQSMAVETVRLGDINLGARLFKGDLYFDKVKLCNRNSLLNISGHVQVFEPESLTLPSDPAFQFNLKGDAVFLEDFVDNLSGRFSMTAHCEGTAAQPEAAVNIYGTDLDLGVQKVKKVRLFSDFEGEKIRIDPLQITITPEEHIEARGWFSLKKAYEIALVSEGISLHHIDKIRELNIAKGKMAFGISGKGSFEDPRIRGEIDLSDLRIKGKALDDFRLNIDLYDNLLHIRGNPNFDINGSFHLQKKDFSVSMLFDETSLYPYFNIANYSDFSGSLTGKIEARGNADALKRTILSADFSKIDIFFKEKVFAAARDFKIFFEKQEISIPSFNLNLFNRGRVDIKGKGGLDGPLFFQVEGRIPLEEIRPFVEDIADITGDLTFSAAVGGTFANPDVHADIELEDTAFAIPELLQKVHNLNGRICINRQEILIDNITGGLDTGRFGLTGKINLDRFQPAGLFLKVNAESLPIQIPDVLDIILDTRVEIRGNSEKSMAEGEVVILEGRYYKDMELDIAEAIRQKRREEAPLPTEIRAPFLRNMSLDILIKHRRPFLVDNNVALLEIIPDLRISGKLNNPIISGRADIKTGTVNFQKKMFVIKKGVIDFKNPYKTDPTLDLRSEIQIRHWMIYLKISGTPDDLVLKIISDPPEKEEDILSLIMLGKTTHELISDEGGTSQSPAQMLAKLISLTLEEDIKKASGLDILEIETQEQGEEKAADADTIQVTIGKKLSRRLTIKYSVKTEGGMIRQRAVAEYKLLDKILFNGFQDSEGIFGVKLRFRVEFR